MKILVIGAEGMLGNAVFRYLTEETTHTVVKSQGRFPDKAFCESVVHAQADFIVNCAGAIPQTNQSDQLYTIVNVDLPVYLESLGVKVIHPSTDCEFSGTLSVGSCYAKDSVRDAHSAYGKSKALISERIEREFQYTKIIRVSIIGHGVRPNQSLLDWFLSQEGPVAGYTDHYWNGITTLEWAKQCAHLIDNWAAYPKVTQLGTAVTKSKYELLCAMRDVYTVPVDIVPKATGNQTNLCLQSDKSVPTIEDQLQELRDWYGRTRKKILITGAGGFIGKNLQRYLSAYSEYELLLADSQTPEDDLLDMVAAADFIVHLAGVMRTNEPQDFYVINRDLTQKIVKTLIDEKRTTPIWFASSVHATGHTDYALSKRAAEDLVREYGLATGARTYIVRLSHTFGPGARPNHASAVATFCHNVIHGLEVMVTDENIELDLIYIDDLIGIIHHLIEGKKDERIVEQLGYWQVVKVHRRNLGQIVDLLRGFKQARDTAQSLILDDEFEQALYTTFVAHIAPTTVPIKS